jgi:hypothetical protein
MKHRKGCTFGWDGACVVGCPYHPATSRLGNVREASGVESKFVEAAEDRHWQAFKFVSPGVRGVPDRMVLKGIDLAAEDYSERFGVSDVAARAMIRMYLAMCIEFAELKAPGKDATLKQLRMHKKFDRFGFHVDVIDTSAAVKEWYASRS